MNPQEQGQQVDDERLRQAAHARRERLPQDERRARGRGDQQLVDDAQVALPDNADAIEDRDEEDALGENARGHEVQVGQAAGRNRPNLAEHLAEDDEPERRLHRARQQLGGVVAKLARLHVGDGERLVQEPCGGFKWIPGPRQSQTSRVVGLCGGLSQFHGRLLLPPGYRRRSARRRHPASRLPGRATP